MRIRMLLALAILGAIYQSTALAQSSQVNLRDRTLEWIRFEETKLQQMQSSHADASTMARASEELGELCQSAGMYPQAEAAFRRAINLYPTEGASESLTARNSLATVLVTEGEYAEAEHQDRIVLDRAENVGDADAEFVAWINLADVESLRNHFTKAINYSRKALLLDEAAPAMLPIGRVLAEQVLGFALAGDRQCEQAIPVLKEVVVLSKNSYGDQSGEAAINQYVLGHAAWECGDTTNAAAWMQQGILRMKDTLGSGHLGYLHAMEEYAVFLNENGRQEEAATVEREVRMANATVDARTMAPITASLR